MCTLSIHISRILYSFYPPLLLSLKKFYMSFSQQKVAVQLSLSLSDLKWKNEHVFFLLFGIVHVQLASADILWAELVTFKTLQMLAVLQVSALLRAAAHKIHLSLVRSGCIPYPLKYNLQLIVQIYLLTAVE